MGQRHNRRRTRPRPRNQSNQSQGISTSTNLQFPTSPLLVPSLPVNNYSYTASACISPGSPVPAHLAPNWHYGYTVWQFRDNATRASDGLEADQYRLFGGEPGDDVSLCYRMLEYFGGLDYIDSTRNSTPGD